MEDKVVEWDGELSKLAWETWHCYDVGIYVVVYFGRGMVRPGSCLAVKAVLWRRRHPRGQRTWCPASNNNETEKRDMPEVGLSHRAAGGVSGEKQGLGHVHGWHVGWREGSARLLHPEDTTQPRGWDRVNLSHPGVSVLPHPTGRRSALSQIPRRKEASSVPSTVTSRGLPVRNGEVPKHPTRLADPRCVGSVHGKNTLPCPWKEVQVSCGGSAGKVQRSYTTQCHRERVNPESPAVASQERRFSWTERQNF